MQVLIYRTAGGREPLTQWLEGLKDGEAIIRIRQRLRRLEFAHAGDSKSLGGGLHELRFFFGPGYRVYYGVEGKALVVLLCGGDKSTQQRDIRKAKEYWEDFQENRHG